MNAIITEDFSIQITGEASSNIIQFKTRTMAAIEAERANPLLKEEDFVRASDAAKSFKKAEQFLEEKKKQALDQTSSIRELFEAIDEVQGALRTARLELDKAAKANKEKAKNKFIKDAYEDFFKEWVDVSKESRLPQQLFPDQTEGMLLNAIHGKSSLEQIEKACKSVTLEQQKNVKAFFESLSAKAALIDAAGSPELFQDRNNLIQRPLEEVKLTIQTRKAAQEARIKEAAEQAERQAIAREREEEQRRQTLARLEEQKNSQTEQPNPSTIPPTQVITPEQPAPVEEKITEQVATPQSGEDQKVQNFKITFPSSMSRAILVAQTASDILGFRVRLTTVED